MFVELAYTPWIYRLDGAGRRLETHTGLAVVESKRVYLDERGDLLFISEHGPGKLLDTDLPAMIDRFTDADALAAALAHFQPGEVKGLGFRWQGRVLPVETLTRANASVALRFVAKPTPE